MLLTASSDVGTYTFTLGLLDAKDRKLPLRRPVMYFKGTPTNVSISVSSTDEIYSEILKPFHYQLMHTMLKNTELLKHSKITLQHVSVYAETIFRELQSVLG